jgi:hypothetical protein
MYHRVDQIGAAQAPTALRFGVDSELIADDADGWIATRGGKAIHRYASRDIRISLLWKAVMFRDEEDARVYDQHLDDLDLDTAVDIMCEGAKACGVPVARPANPLRDVKFMNDLERAFPWRTHFAPIETDV